jgi:hypothetical protein
MTRLYLRTSLLTFLLVWSHLSWAQVKEVRVPRPLVIVDSSGQDVGTYCVAGLYARRSGAGLVLSDPDRRTSDPKLYLMWPRVVKAGEQTESRKTVEPHVIFPFVFGESLVETGFLILKSGFEPLLWNAYLDRRNPKTIALTEGDSKSELDDLVSGRASAQRLREIFRKRSDRDHVSMGTIEGREIVDRYANEDREFLKHCYYDLSSAP